MLCEECRQKEATIHIVKQMDGKQAEMNLCEHCARKKDELEVKFEPQFSLHKLFASMLNQSLRDSRWSQQAVDTQCHSCGLTFSQFSQIGKLGCSDCFEAFKEQLKPLLRRIHAGCAHTGKVPLKIQDRVKAVREIDQIKEELQAKINNEEFEEAAILRDRIRALEEDIRQEQTDGGEKH